MEIKILGTGCPNCVTLEKNAKTALKALGIDARLKKVTDIVKIMEYGVMSTPAIVVDEEVKAYGKVCTVDEIKKLLS